MSDWTKIASFAAVAALCWGCSPGAAEFTECTETSACQVAFGPNFTCGSEGLCEEVVLPSRCASVETVPADLLLPGRYANPVVLGSLLEFSVTTKVQRANAIRLAVEQVNALDGLDGRPFGVVFCDISEDTDFDGLSPREATVETATFLVDQLGVAALIGPSGSSNTIAAHEAVRDSGTLVISMAATSPAITGLEPAATDAAPGILWRTATPDTLQGRAIAEDMTERGVGRVAIVHVADSYGEGLTTEFSQAFGGETALFPFTNDAEREEIPVLLANRAAEFDEILFISGSVSDVIAFMNGVANPVNQSLVDAELGLFFTDAANNDLFSGVTQDAANLLPRVRRTRPLVAKTETYNFFASAFGVQFGGDVNDFTFTAQSYDAAWLVMFGSAWSALNEGEITGTGIARGMRKVSQGAPVQIRASAWSQLLANAKNDVAFDIVGASGNLDYDPTTEETAGPVEILVVNAAGDDFEAVATISP